MLRDESGDKHAYCVGGFDVGFVERSMGIENVWGRQRLRQREDIVLGDLVSQQVSSYLLIFSRRDAQPESLFKMCLVITYIIKLIPTPN